jgi:hypothetical protein
MVQQREQEEEGRGEEEGVEAALERAVVVLKKLLQVIVECWYSRHACSRCGSLMSSFQGYIHIKACLIYIVHP